MSQYYYCSTVASVVCVSKDVCLGFLVLILYFALVSLCIFLLTAAIILAVRMCMVPQFLCGPRMHH
jgi:hypothetical protein